MKTILETFLGLIKQIRSTYGERFKQVADIMFGRVTNGKLIYGGLGGHSSIFSDDAMYRKGELAALCPIYDVNI